MRFFNDKDFDKNHLAENPNLTPEQIDLLYQTKGVDKDNLAAYSKLTDEQFMRFFNDGDLFRKLGVKKYLAQNPSINPPPANQPFASGVFNWSW